MSESYSLVKKLKEIVPQYDAMFHEIIQGLAVVGGDNTHLSKKEKETNEVDDTKHSQKHESTFKKGKFFSTVYELYMYAAFLGIQANRKPEMTKGDSKKDFGHAIKNWAKHTDISKFLLMALLVKADIDFGELDGMDDNQLNDIVAEIKKLLENYANGGFYIIKEKMKESFFLDEDHCFLDLLKDNEFALK